MSGAEWQEASRVLSVSDAIRELLSKSGLKAQDQLLALLFIVAEDLADYKLTKEEVMTTLHIAVMSVAASRVSARKRRGEDVQ